jgi:hypothetical protein
MGQGSAIGWPLGRFPKVPDFGIFSPLNVAPSADSGQKGPQIGLKIGFGAQKKKGHANGFIKPIGNILVQFYFAS